VFRASSPTNCGDGPSVPMARSYRNVLLSFGKKKVSKENLFGAHLRSRVPTRERSERRTLFFCLLFFSREKKSKGGSPKLYPGLSCVSATDKPVADTAGRGFRGRRCGPVHEGVRISQDRLTPLSVGCSRKMVGPTFAFASLWDLSGSDMRDKNVPPTNR